MNKSTMIFCDNANCEMGDEPIERVSDYRIYEGAVICTLCHEQAMDYEEELQANKADFE